MGGDIPPQSKAEALREGGEPNDLQCVIAMVAIPILGAHRREQDAARLVKAKLRCDDAGRLREFADAPALTLIPG